MPPPEHFHELITQATAALKEWRHQASLGEAALQTVSTCLADARRPRTPLPNGPVRDIALSLATPALLRFAAGERPPDASLPERLSAAILQLNASTKKSRRQHAALADAAGRLRDITLALTGDEDGGALADGQASKHACSADSCATAASAGGGRRSVSESPGRSERLGMQGVDSVAADCAVDASIAASAAAEGDALVECDAIGALQQRALLWGAVAASVGRECDLFEVVTANVHHATSAEHFEAYIAFWTLHPFVDDQLLARLCGEAT